MPEFFFSGYCHRHISGSLNFISKPPNKITIVVQNLIEIKNAFKNNLTRVVIVLDPYSAISPETAASDELQPGIPGKITISVEHQY